MSNEEFSDTEAAGRIRFIDLGSILIVKAVLREIYREISGFVLIGG